VAAPVFIFLLESACLPAFTSDTSTNENSDGFTDVATIQSARVQTTALLRFHHHHGVVPA
jgi:hypothetical protein